MTRALDVWWESRRVGQLMQDRHGDLSFAYAPEWLADGAAPPLSASLPKRPEHFSRRECRPFFGGLLPEEGQREAAAQVLGVSRANDFALLDRLGGDVAGALQLLPPGDLPAKVVLDLQAIPLGDDELINLLDTLPRRPLLAGAAGLRLSLAGAQSKVPVVLVNDQIALPAPGQPTTHILKPPIPRFAATTENEAVVMRLAAAIGLDVASVEPRFVRDRTFLLVRRYDRAFDATGTIRRVHQEDFCQALGIPPERKYASEGGPTFKDCFALLRHVATNPAADVLKLLDAVIFNAIVGNSDAHGKNFSILYGRRNRTSRFNLDKHLGEQQFSEEYGLVSFAPLYDLLATVAYPELSPSFAMKIGRRGTLSELEPSDWQTFGTDAGLGMPLIRKRVIDMCEHIGARIPAVVAELSQPGLNAAAIERLAELISERARSGARTVTPAR